MTKDEALKLALEALEEAWYHVGTFQPTEKAIDLYDEARTAIKEALAQPEHGWTPERIAGMARLKDAQDKKLAQPEQEPVGQLLENAFGRGQVMWFNKPKDESMLYTTPPQRTWVGLTDEEILAVNMSTVTKLIDEPIVCDTDHNIVQLGKAIEAKLKEKNT